MLYSQKTGAETIVDAGDGGDDTDGDGDTITYECWFDQNQDDSVTESAGTQCGTANLTGISFTSGTGVLSWDPTDAQTGSYEFKIKATANGQTDTAYQDLTVTSANLRLPATLGLRRPILRRLIMMPMTGLATV